MIEVLRVHDFEELKRHEQRTPLDDSEAENVALVIFHPVYDREIIFNYSRETNETYDVDHVQKYESYDCEEE